MHPFNNDTKRKISYFFSKNVYARQEADKIFRDKIMTALHGDGNQLLTPSIHKDDNSYAKIIFFNGPKYNLFHGKHTLSENIKTLIKYDLDPLPRDYYFYEFLNTESTDHLESFPAKSIIICHKLLNNIPATKEINEYFVNSIKNYQNNILFHFAISFILAPNFHSFSIKNEHNHVSTFTANINGTNFEELQTSQSYFLKEFFNFIYSLHKSNADLPIQEFLSDFGMQTIPKWLSLLQKNHLINNLAISLFSNIQVYKNTKSFLIIDVLNEINEISILSRALAYSVKYKNLDTANKLLTYNISCEHGSSSFIAAIDEGCNELLIPLTKKCDIFYTNNLGLSALDCAIHNNNYYATETLLKKGAIFNLLYKYHKALLIHSLANNSLALTKLLLNSLDSELEILCPNPVTFNGVTIDLTNLDYCTNWLNGVCETIKLSDFF